MNKSIATEKEKILEEFDDRFQWSQNASYVFVNKRKELVRIFLYQSLDHIASVARQEGREEAIEEISDCLKWHSDNFERADMYAQGYFQARSDVAKLTGKEEK